MALEIFQKLTILIKYYSLSSELSYVEDNSSELICGF